MNPLKAAPLSKETREKIQKFEKAQKQFRELWTKFEELYSEELEHLEQLREERNFLLDEAVRALREDAESLDPRNVKVVAAGQFQATKRWRPFYNPEMFVSICRQLGLEEEAVSLGIIKWSVSVDYKKAKRWIEERKLEKKFKAAEDGKEMSVAIKGPKPVPSLGEE